MYLLDLIHLHYMDIDRRTSRRRGIGSEVNPDTIIQMAI